MTIKSKIKNYFTMDDEYEYEYIEEETLSEEPIKKSEKDKVVSLQGLKQPNQKVVLCEPRSYNEVQEIADNIVNKRAVVVNLQRVDNNQGKRIIDFLSGTVYAVNGDIQKLGSDTFLCTPDNVEVAGNISETIHENDEF